MPAHELILDAADGRLPDWAQAGPSRREHMARVGALLGAWADALALPDDERARWRAAGVLHDVLRDADPATLRPRVPPALAELPGRVLHGPAASERLWAGGVRDGEFLRAIAFHTLGHPDFGPLGRALYAADFLEPGRTLLDHWRAELRACMPGQLAEVVREVLGARIRHQVERHGPLRPETLAFWTRLAEGDMAVWISSSSAIWSPTFITGLSAVIGS